MQSGQTGTNILAIIPGSEIPDEYIFVGAHYDHLATCRTVDVGDTVCNGATDNAAGVAAALGVARGIAALPTAPRRSVVLAFWDTEEDNLLGSALLPATPDGPIANTVGYINFDIQGANLLPSFATSPSRSARRPARGWARWSARRRPAARWTSAN